MVNQLIMATLFDTFLEEVDYNAKDFKGGWDVKLKDPNTLMLVDFVKTLLTDGYRNSYIKKKLIEELHLSVPGADLLIAKCWKLLRSTDTEEQLRAQNIKRLERIYELAIAEDNLKAATSAIAELNKMNGFNKQTVEITDNSYIMKFGDE